MLNDGLFSSKTREATRNGADKVVCLLPARTDTARFLDYIYNKAEVRFLRGRVKFGGGKNSAPFPSMIVVFKKKQMAGE
jgi:site-specific DNA-methyltransferase (adenine-specific)